MDAPQETERGIEMSVEVLKQIWPEWQIEGKPLGKGSFGVVYKAVRRDHNVESYAAIKAISIPTDPSEVDSLRSEGMDANATKTYLQRIVNDFVSEIQLMESLKGVPNIVSVEDYKVVERVDEIGWDIFIRMELLTSFNTYICDKKLTEDEVIKLGCDICTALEICAKRNIIHRDIKPENIFINDFGYFKLGDFGIARKLENMTDGLSQKGTYNYMAPEVAYSNEYDARVDIYSLGIVLYRLLNRNRLPFLETDKQLLNPNERRNAVERRIRGEKLPAPCDASPAMADVILRACAYDPNMRFASAAEMKQALIRVANGTCQVGTGGLDRTVSVRKVPVDYDRTFSVRKAPVDDDRTMSVRRAPSPFPPSDDPVENSFGPAPKQRSRLPIIIAAAALVLLFGAVFLIKGIADSQEKDTVNQNTEEPVASSDSAVNLPDPSVSAEPTIETVYEEIHVHSWQGATCTNPQYCVTCGESIGNVLPHQWMNATHNAPKTCQNCGITDGLSLGTSLLSCAVMDDSQSPKRTDIVTGTIIDESGVKHTNAVMFWVSDASGYVNTEHIVYRLDAPFDIFSGTITLGEDSHEGAAVRFYIYSGEVLLYQSGYIRGTMEESFQISVAGVDQLRIECETDEECDGYGVLDAALYFD